jgi:hypothetical protein
MPEHEAVLALTGGITSIQASLDLVWEHLLPGFGVASEPVEIGLLQLPLEPGARPADTVTVTIESGEQSWFTIESLTVDVAGITIVDAAGTHHIACGFGSWTSGATGFGGGNDDPVAASASWTSDTTWVGLIWLTATPFRYRIELTIDGDAASLSITSNVSFGSTELAQLSGRVTR